VTQGSFEQWIEVHCYDCGYPHKWLGGHDHCFDERNGPRPQDYCNCGGCRHARGQSCDERTIKRSSGEDQVIVVTKENTWGYTGYTDTGELITAWSDNTEAESK
jgi:hypothetical protein